MAKFVIWNEPAPNIVSDNRKIIVTVDKLAIGSDLPIVSQTPNNIITQKPDGLYATINHAPTIQSWITSFNDNLT